MDLYSGNPFRILGLRSDASAKDVARVADRLLKWIEIGEKPQVAETLPYLPCVTRDREDIKSAVNQIEDPRIRIQWEIFWPTASNSYFDSCCDYLAQGKYNEFVTLCEREISKADLREGRDKQTSANDKLNASLCRHFLAIFLHSIAISHTTESPVQRHESSQIVDWARAFQHWLTVYRDDLFWAYFEQRVEDLNDPRMAGFEVSQIRDSLPGRLLEVSSSLALAALEKQKPEAFVYNVRIIRKSPFATSECDRSLKIVIAPLVSQFQKALAEITPLLSESGARERTSSLRQLPDGTFEGTIDPEKFRSYFSKLNEFFEKKLIPVGELVQMAVLGSTEDGRELLDNLAYALRRLSLATHNVGDMPKKAVEITRTARRFAKSSECDERLAEDEKSLQFISLQREAVNASDAKQYDQAILKLEESKKYATAEEQATVDEWIAATRRRAVFGSDKPIASAPAMYTLNGIGTALYGRRSFDQSTQTYIATLFFVIFFVPIFPIAAYRVKNAGGSKYQFLGKVPLTKWAFLPSLIVVLLIIVMSLSGSFDSPSPPSAPTTSTSRQDSSSPNSGSDSFDTSRQTPSVSNSKTRLSQWLDRERTRLENEESQMDSLKVEIERDRTHLHATFSSLGETPNQQEAEDYKSMEDRFNSKVSSFNNLLEAHHLGVQHFNSEVQRYNSMQ